MFRSGKTYFPVDARLAYYRSESNHMRPTFCSEVIINQTNKNQTIRQGCQVNTKILRVLFLWRICINYIVCMYEY